MGYHGVIKSWARYQTVIEFSMWMHSSARNVSWIKTTNLLSGNSKSACEWSPHPDSVFYVPSRLQSEKRPLFLTRLTFVTSASKCLPITKSRDLLLISCLPLHVNAVVILWLEIVRRGRFSLYGWTKVSKRSKEVHLCVKFVSLFHYSVNRRSLGPNVRPLNTCNFDSFTEHSNKLPNKAKIRKNNIIDKRSKVDISRSKMTHGLEWSPFIGIVVNIL